VIKIMPKLMQGNIFESQANLSVIFGHKGFNEMHEKWVTFKSQNPSVRHIDDPFFELANRPQKVNAHKWLWFVPEEHNHGLTESRLKSALDAALSWAIENRITSIATNGIANTDHGMNTAHNRESDDLRAKFIIKYAEDLEQQHDITVELVSLNDVFIR
jgi:hypothetical protein